METGTMELTIKKVESKSDQAALTHPAFFTFGNLKHGLGSKQRVVQTLISYDI